MDVKEIYSKALNQKAEQLEELIEKVQGEIEHLNTQLEEAKENNRSESEKYYLEGLIEGMQQVNRLLKIFNSK